MTGFEILSIVDTMASLAILGWGLILSCQKRKYKKVTLSCGSFKVRRKFYNRADLTTIVRDLYYGGGDVPGNIVKEITSLLCKPNKDYKEVTKND